MGRSPSCLYLDQFLLAYRPIVSWYDIMKVSRRHRKTFLLIFEHAVRSDIPWEDIERLLVALGVDVSEGRGPRIRVYLNEARAVFHRPHPQRETDQGTLRSVRRFLREAGFEPEE